MHPLISQLKRFFGRATGWLLAMGERGWIAGVIVTALYGVCLTWVHTYHEFWRDEIHCWSEVLVASGPWDITVGDRRYDGHPPLWYYVLELATVFTRGPVGLHVVTVLLSTAGTYLLYQFGRLPRVLRLLLPYTYLWFYEYGVVSRSYTLGLALLFLFCATHRPRRPRYVVSSIVLTFLGMTSAFAFMEAGALALYLFIGGLRPGRKATDAADQSVFADGEVKHPERAKGGPRARWALGLAIFVLGAAFTTITTLPPRDAGVPASSLHVTLDHVRAAGWRYWLTTFPNARDWLVITAFGDQWPSVAPMIPFAAVGLFFVALFSLRQSPLLAGTYALAVTAMLVFQEVKYGTGVRHTGHYFLMFIACGWLAARVRERVTPLPVYSILLGLAVLVQIPSMVRATRVDIDRPFSTALEAARFIRPLLTPDTVIFGGHGHATSPVAAYLDRDIVITGNAVPRRTVVYNSNWTDLGIPRLLELAATETARAHPVILVMIAPLNDQREDLTTTLLHVTADPIAPDEKYWIYEARKPNPPLAPSPIPAQPAGASRTPPESGPSR